MTSTCAGLLNTWTVCSQLLCTGMIVDPVLLKSDDRSIMSELRSSSATWLEVLTKRGTQILMLSVLELQSSALLLECEEPWLDTEELAQLGPFSSLTQIFSPLIKVIWLTM